MQFDVNKSSVYKSLEDLATEVANYLFMFHVEHSNAANLFRRSSDHALAIYWDIASLCDSQVMAKVLTWLNIPVPMTSLILTNPSNSSELICTHLANLLMANEDVALTCHYLETEIERNTLCYLMDLNARHYLELVQKCAGKLEMLSLYQMEEDHAPICSVGVNRLLHLAVMKKSQHTVSWMMKVYPALANGVDTLLVATLANDFDFMVKHGKTWGLTFSEVKWVASYCSVEAMRKAIELKWARVETLQAVFDTMTSMNTIRQVIADVMLEKVNCNNTHMERALSNCNLPLSELLTTRCRNWNPASSMKLLQDAKVQRALNKADVALSQKWIHDWLVERNLPCEQSIHSDGEVVYRVGVDTVTRGGLIERRCKMPYRRAWRLWEGCNCAHV